MCVRQVADRLPLENITEAELAIAMAPGMYGRIWYGQGLAFDEAYMILQDHYTCVAHRPLSIDDVHCWHVVYHCHM